MPNRWLVKTEPSAYSYEDLERDGSTVWDGVTNALARIHLRAMRKGDAVAVYHTGAVKAVVGIAEVARGPRLDPRAGDEKAVVVDLAPRRRLRAPVPLGAFRAVAALASWDLIRNGRLSVMPVPPEAWALLR